MSVFTKSDDLEVAGGFGPVEVVSLALVASLYVIASRPLLLQLASVGLKALTNRRQLSKMMSACEISVSPVSSVGRAWDS